MEPATIAIIPLILVVAGVAFWIGSSVKRGKGNTADVIGFAFFGTAISVGVFMLLAHLAGVVYFNSWSF